MAEIEEARNAYMIVAERASILYFVVAEMGNIDPMYQWSLEYFTAFFKARMAVSERSDDIPTRAANMIADLTHATFVDICHGLFEDRPQRGDVRSDVFDRR